MQMYLKEIKGVISKNILKSVNRFNSTNEINNFNRGRGNKKEKNIRRNCRTSQNIRIVSIFLESLLSAPFSSLEVTVHLVPPRVSSNTA